MSTNISTKRNSFLNGSNLFNQSDTNKFVSFCFIKQILQATRGMVPEQYKQTKPWEDCQYWVAMLMRRQELAAHPVLLPRTCEYVTCYGVREETADVIIKNLKMGRLSCVIHV